MGQEGKSTQCREDAERHDVSGVPYCRRVRHFWMAGFTKATQFCVEQNSQMAVPGDGWNQFLGHESSERPLHAGHIRLRLHIPWSQTGLDLAIYQVCLWGGDAPPHLALVFG